MTEEIINDKEDKTKKHRNNEIDCLHFSCRKGESGKVLLWCGFYDDHCDNYTGCYYRKYLRLEQENENLKKEVKQIGSDFIKKGDYARELEQENRELKAYKDVNEDFKKAWDELNKKYTEVLKLAKTNADSNEYCLQELEKENKELKKQIESQKGLITVGRKQQYQYLQKIEELEQENKELKVSNSNLDNQLHITVEMMNNCNNRLQNYRSALEEIREIEELAYYSKGVPEEPLSQRDFILDAINNYEQRRIKILTKINEVLNESK